jgi:chitinase
MAIHHPFITTLLLFVYIYIAAAAFASSDDWEAMATSLRGTLQVLQISQEQCLGELPEQHARRSTRSSGSQARYWRPTTGKRFGSSDNSSGQVHVLINQIGTSIEQLLELIAAQLDQQHSPNPTTSASLASTPSPAQQSILPITNVKPMETVSSSSPPSLVPDSSLTRSVSAPTSTYTFNPQARDLNVAYYSQTDLTKNVTLTQLCADPNVDIVILAFVTSLVAEGGYPSINMASNCWAPNTAQMAAGATGLLDCVGDGSSAKIKLCQNTYGKKVMLSLGGSVGNLALQSDDQAKQVANTLWNLFLGGKDPMITPLRPYGDVVLDGIDIDSELPSASTYLPALAFDLRQLMSTGSKPYYMSAAPQCPRPDASVPIPLMLPYLDFVSVQFYNNPSCNLNSGQGFLSSLQAWSGDLASMGASVPSSKSRFTRQAKSSSGSFVKLNNNITVPRLLIGTPAFQSAGTGYVDVPTYQGILQSVKALNLPNIAGAMYWDGAYLEHSSMNVNRQNNNYAAVVRQVLGL